MILYAITKWYNSLKTAKEDLKAENINRVLRGDCLSSNGCIFKYEGANEY